MRNSRLNSISQLAAVWASFVVAILLLDSQALLTWAQRLDVSQAQPFAVAITYAIHTRLAPLGLETLRQKALAKLDLLGWSDDPARLASARLQTDGARRDGARILNSRDIHGSLGLSHAQRQPTSNPLNSKATADSSSSISTTVPRITTLPPLPISNTTKPRVVALAGDSMMAVGLSDVLLRDAAGDKNLQVVKAYRSGTGLARPDVFDWMQEYPAMIGNRQPDVIFVAIGANDGQGFVEDGKVLPFASDAWIRVYRQRTAAFLDLLTEHGARVVWVGLPPMKPERFNERTALINRIAYSVVSQNAQATWWNPVSFLGDEAGDYREFATLANGKTMRIRAADGIHLSDDGAELLAPALMHWLESPAPAITTASAQRDKSMGPSHP
jgi:hypothetical protein